MNADAYWFIVKPTPANCEQVKAWLRGLGDGYILFDRADLFAKVEGPLVVEEINTEDLANVDLSVVPASHQVSHWGKPPSTCIVPTPATSNCGNPISLATRPSPIYTPTNLPIHQSTNFQPPNLAIYRPTNAPSFTTGTGRTRSTSYPLRAGRCRCGILAC